MINALTTSETTSATGLTLRRSFFPTAHEPANRNSPPSGCAKIRYASGVYSSSKARKPTTQLRDSTQKAKMALWDNHLMVCTINKMARTLQVGNTV